MKEENPYGCRALSSSSRKDSIVQSNSVLSSFVSITFPQPKIRITMPKLLAKTLHRRNLQKCDDTENANDSTTTTKKKKKKNNNKWIKPGNLFPKKVGSIVSNVFGNKKSAEKSCKKDGIGSEAEVSKTELEVPLSSPGRTSNKRNGNMKGKQASSSNLIRVSSRKIRMARSMRKKEITDRAEEEEEEEEEERGEEELCKKRILMGKKCRPLNVCGALHYDENGVLLPEEEYRCERNVNH